MSVGYSWVQLLWVRGWANAYSSNAWQSTRPVLRLHAAWASVNTDTSRQCFTQVHDRSPVLHTTTGHDRAVTDRASIANCAGKISRHQTLQNVSPIATNQVFGRSVPPQKRLSSLVCPACTGCMSIISDIHQVDIMLYSTMANSPPSTSLLMSSLDTHPATSRMTISSNTTLVPTDHYILQALPPHGSSQNDHIPTDVI